MNLFASSFGHGIDLPPDVAPELGRCEKGYDLELLDALDRLRDEGDKALPSDPDVLVIIVGPVDGEVVRPRAHPVDRGLTGRADPGPDPRPCDFSYGLGR